MADSGISSPAFERFRWSFFEDEYFWHDGLDLAALLQLAGEERRRAEEMLIGQLPDARGIIGLGELRSRRAEPALRLLFDAEHRAQSAAADDPDAGWSPYRVVHLAKALWQIRPEPRWLAAVTDILARADLDGVQRLDAAMALSVFRDPVAIRALVAALEDPEALVRYHAARALLVMHGLIEESDVTNDPKHMMYRLMSDDPARRDGGKRELLCAIAEGPIDRP